MPTVSLDVTRSGWNGDVKEIEKALISLQEYLFWILQVLDSGNVKFLNTNRTVIRSEDRTTHIDGSQIKMLDIDKSPRLVMGYNSETNKYEFTMYNKSGATTITLDENGNAIFKGKLQGASIESDSTIDVETDLRVGDNIYVGEENEANGTTKKVQFFEGESAFNRATIKATKASDGGINLDINAPTIILNTIDGVIDGRDNKAFITTGHTGAYVTISGVNYPVYFE